MSYRLQAIIKGADGKVYNTITVPYLSTKKEAEHYAKTRIVDDVKVQRKIRGIDNIQAVVTIKKT